MAKANFRIDKGNESIEVGCKLVDGSKDLISPDILNATSEEEFINAVELHLKDCNSDTIGENIDSDIDYVFNCTFNKVIIDDKPRGWN